MEVGKAKSMQKGVRGKLANSKRENLKFETPKLTSMKQYAYLNFHIFENVFKGQTSNF